MRHHIYHHNDMDGHSSGALIGIALERQGVNPSDITYYEMQYGMSFDDSAVNYEKDKVYMVDFALQPYERMSYLIEKGNLTWIDHHQTSYEWITGTSYGLESFQGAITEGDKAACELCWDYYFDTPAPKFIKMISHFDIWNKDSEYLWDDQILPLQMYLKTRDTRPGFDAGWWKDIVTMSLETPTTAQMWMDRWIKIGKDLKEFNDTRQRKLTLAHGYEGNFCGYKAFILNTIEGGSLQFEVAIDVDQYELLVAYRQYKDEYWVINLYSTNPKVECGSLAKRLGSEGPYNSGGGHPGAAGFQTSTDHLLDLLKK